MSRITLLKYMYLQIYIVQTKRSATVKIDIIISVIINVVSFETYVCVYGVAENSTYISNVDAQMCFGI